MNYLRHTVWRCAVGGGRLYGVCMQQDGKLFEQSQQHIEDMCFFKAGGTQVLYKGIMQGEAHVAAGRRQSSSLFLMFR